MGITTINNGINQALSIRYSAITDSSVDWTGITNSTYFYDKDTRLPYYKNSGGTVVSLFEEGGSGGSGADTFVTGGTYTSSASTITLNRNDGNSVSISGITSGGGSSDTLYTADGTLSGTRSVNLGSNTLTFLSGNTTFQAENGTSNDLSEYIARFRNSANSASYGIIANDGYFDFGVGNAISNTDFSTCFQLGHSNSINSTSAYFGLVGRSNTLTGSGNYRYILGSGNNTSSGNEQVIVGVDNTVSANYTAMIGSEGTLSGQFSSAIGRAHNITHQFVFGAGAWVKSGANGASIIGHGVEADKTQKLVNNTANSLALGWNSTGATHLFKSTGAELGGKVEMTTTDNGLLMPRLTTAQMNAISSPDTHLVIFNTDLNALYRYNGSAWVVMAAGYGLVGVVRDSDNGNPTFYSDLQSALDTCKASGSYNTVTLYGNHTTTTGIVIDSTFDYKYLTINFNGFKLENTQSGTTHTLDITNLVAGATTVLLDGSLIRENGTNGKCINHNGATRNIQMSKMYLYNDTYLTLNFGSGDESYDFGGSVFESGASATIQPLRLSYGNFRNFTVISNSSQSALFMTNSANATDFTAINTSTGGAITTQTSCIASNFYAETVSGNAVGGGVFSNFVAKSVSGIAVNGPTSAHDFIATTGDNKAVNVGAFDVSNFRAENDSSTHACVYLSNTNECVQVYAKNKGSGVAFQVFVNQANRSFSYNKITAISEGGIGASVSSNPGFKILFSGCEFVSKWDDVGGHSVQIGGNDTVLTNCSLRVRNAGANNITASSSITAKVANSTFDGATTPINSNVTLSNTFTSDPYGNITI